MKAVNESKKTDVHDTYVVYHEGVEIAPFGIRRSPKKGLPHGHIPGELHLGPNQCLNLARCPLSRDGWIDLLRDRGLIAPDQEAEEQAAADTPAADEGPAAGGHGEGVV